MCCVCSDWLVTGLLVRKIRCTNIPRRAPWCQIVGDNWSGDSLHERGDKRRVRGCWATHETGRRMSQAWSYRTSRKNTRALNGVRNGQPRKLLSQISNHGYRIENCFENTRNFPQQLHAVPFCILSLCTKQNRQYTWRRCAVNRVIKHDIVLYIGIFSFSQDKVEDISHHCHRNRLADTKGLYQQQEYLIRKREHSITSGNVIYQPSMIWIASDRHCDPTGYPCADECRWVGWLFYWCALDIFGRMWKYLSNWNTLPYPRAPL